jgi:hypothetical protein
VAGSYACGLRTDGTIACWENQSIGGTPFTWPAAPTGTFTSVSVGGACNCGVRTDGTIACWGGWGNNSCNPPAM